MSTYISFELKDLLKQTKNRLILVLILLLSLFYAIFLFPKETNYDLQLEELKIDVANREQFIENALKRDTLNMHPTVWQAVQEYPKYIEPSNERIANFEKKDWLGYTEATLEYHANYPMLFSVGLPIPFRFLQNTPFFPQLMALHYFSKEYVRYDGYLTKEQPLNEHIFAEKTLLQSLTKNAGILLTYLVLTTFVLMIYDLVSKDRNHKSLLNQFPLSPIKRFFSKGIAALIISLLIFLMTLPAMGIITFKHGFGSFKTTMPAFFPLDEQMPYQNITLGNWFLSGVILFILLILMLYLLIYFISCLLKNGLPAGVLALLLIFSDQLYYSRAGSGYKNYSYFLPSSFIRIPQIIDGSLGFQTLSTQLTPVMGMMVLGSSVVLLLILNLILLRRRPEL